MLHIRGNLFDLGPPQHGSSELSFLSRVWGSPELDKISLMSHMYISLLGVPPIGKGGFIACNISYVSYQMAATTTSSRHDVSSDAKSDEIQQRLSRHND